jgi:hypothetical protein
MNLSKQCQCLKKQTRVRVEVAAFVAIASIALAISEGTTSAAQSNWSSPSSWSSSSRDISTRKQSALMRDEGHNIAPFAPSSNNLSLDVGQVFLMGDLGNNYADAIGSRLHYTYGVSDMFGFDTSVSYSSHSEGKYSMTTFLTGMRMNLSWYDKMIPYAVFGLGFYKPSHEVVSADPKTPITSISPLLFGLHMGPGITLELTRQLFFGASVTFHDVFGTKKITPQGSVLDVDGTFTSFFLHAGVTF